MSTFSFKMLAAGVLVACGLGVGVGSSWVATAEAQTPQKAPPSKNDPDAEVKRLQSQLQEAARAADAARVESQYSALVGQLLAQSRDPKESYTAKTTKWEYDFVEVSDVDQSRFMKFLQDRENRGWEYNGTTTLKDGARKQEIWVFRRPAKAATEYSQLVEQYYRKAADAQKASPYADSYLRIVPGATDDRAKPADAKAIQAEIAKLQEQLARLKAKPETSRLVLAKKELPLPPAQMAQVLATLVTNRFKNADIHIIPSNAGITVEGDKQVLDWVAEMVKALGKQ